MDHVGELVTQQVDLAYTIAITVNDHSIMSRTAHTPGAWRVRRALRATRTAVLVQHHDCMGYSKVVLVSHEYLTIIKHEL
jgi:hypothetical protein